MENTPFKVNHIFVIFVIFRICSIGITKKAFFFQFIHFLLFGIEGKVAFSILAWKFGLFPDNAHWNVHKVTWI